MEKSESSSLEKDSEQKENKASDSNEWSDISISSDEGGSHVFPSLANLNFKPSFFESPNDYAEVDNLMSDSLVYQYLVEEGHNKTAKLLLKEREKQGSDLKERLYSWILDVNISDMLSVMIPEFMKVYKNNDDYEVSHTNDTNNNNHEISHANDTKKCSEPTIRNDKSNQAPILDVVSLIGPIAGLFILPGLVWLFI
jgi:hypothetical protein